jgi:hypothetical protein
MCPVYGLPDRLIDPVAHAIQEIAIHVFDQPPLSWLVSDWSDRVARGEHEELLTPEKAGSLLLVIWEVAQYVYSAPSTSPSDVEFALYADEIIALLRDFAAPLLVAA